MTLFFRNLADFSKDTEVIDPTAFMPILQPAIYQMGEVNEDILEKWKNWFVDYQKHLQAESLTDEQRKAQMNQVNPKYVLRNYMAQLAIDAADKGDYSIIEELYELLKNPYAEQKEKEKWFAKRPEWARHKVGCSMLSCSS